mmetsp:Transcript_30106/g.70983  ORF Transcript_30106/g.70983 Transcript_30106/m.70983 type:complete len:244 (-) Transcript_30106:633-1364(-)
MMMMMMTTTGRIRRMPPRLSSLVVRSRSLSSRTRTRTRTMSRANSHRAAVFPNPAVVSRFQHCRHGHESLGFWSESQSQFQFQLQRRAFSREAVPGGSGSSGGSRSGSSSSSHSFASLAVAAAAAASMITTAKGSDTTHPHPHLHLQYPSLPTTTTTTTMPLVTSRSDRRRFSSPCLVSWKPFRQADHSSSLTWEPEKRRPAIPSARPTLHRPSSTRSWTTPMQTRTGTSGDRIPPASISWTR